MNQSGIPPSSPLTVEEFFHQIKEPTLKKLAQKNQWGWNSYKFYERVRRYRLRELTQKQVQWLFDIKEAVLNYEYYER